MSTVPATQRTETVTAQSDECHRHDTFPLRMWTKSSIICTVLIIHLVECQAGSHTADTAEAVHQRHVSNGSFFSSFRSTLHESSLQQSQRTEAESCNLAAFSDLYHAIDVDLSHWKKAGITQLLMDQSIEALGSMMSHKGIAIMFESGVAYIISDTSHFKRINYHERLVIAHITLMEALQATYGAMIPDVEFVIGTADMPEMYVETRIPPAHPPNNSPSNLQASTDSFSESDLEAHPFQAKSGDSSVLKRPEGAEAGSENIAVASDGRVDQEHRNYFPATSNQLPHRVLNADTSQDNAMKLSLNQNLSESVMVSMPQLQPTQSAEGKKARAMAEDSGLRHQQRHRALLRHPNSSVTVQSVGAGFSSPPLLMLRFCKSVHHADVLVPDIHFQAKGYTHHFLTQKEAINQEWPWSQKQQGLFGRFSPFPRPIRNGATTTYRRGKGGSNICKHEDRERFECDVRKHFMKNWGHETAEDSAEDSALPMDVGFEPKHTMAHHAGFRYLLHLDGQTCSSRLEQLFALQSLVFKEQSGYYAFYHHLIHPYQHYIPFWRQVPEEIFPALTAAIANDTSSHKIAVNAQEFVATHLHKHALSCYWFTLLSHIAPLLRYSPTARTPPGHLFKISVSEYLARERDRVAQVLQSIELYTPLGGVTQGLWLQNDTGSLDYLYTGHSL